MTYVHVMERSTCDISNVYEMDGIRSTINMLSNGPYLHDKIVEEGNQVGALLEKVKTTK